MKTFIFFLCGAAVMPGVSILMRSNPPHHVYELWLYHVHEGKTDALKAHFGDDRSAFFC
jgi:hypothetical protein